MKSFPEYFNEQKDLEKHIDKLVLGYNPQFDKIRGETGKPVPYEVMVKTAKEFIKGVVAKDDKVGITFVDFKNTKDDFKPRGKEEKEAFRLADLEYFHKLGMYANV